MHQKQIDSPIGALRLRQWMRHSGMTDFYVYRGGSSNSAATDIFVEVVVYQDDRRNAFDGVVSALRKCGVYNGYQQYVPAGVLCYLRFGIRVSERMKSNLIGRHDLGDD